MRRATSSVISLPGIILTIGLTIGIAGLPIRAEAQDSMPSYLRDRGTGIPTSLFSTYVEAGQLIVYPVFAYSYDHNREYSPEELFNVGPHVDFRGKQWSVEGQLTIAYGVTDWLALEASGGFVREVFEKSRFDTFGTPARIDESGIGDFEGQLRVRLSRENQAWPEVFSYAEITVPSNRDKVLLSDAGTLPGDWDVKPGIGVIKGFPWGTLTFRSQVEYNRAESKVDIGESALEYMKRLSGSWLVHWGFEGGEGGPFDEWNMLSGVQWQVADHLWLKVDSAFGLQSKSTDWAPEVGLLFVLPTGRQQASTQPMLR